MCVCVCVCARACESNCVNASARACMCVRACARARACVVTFTGVPGPADIRPEVTLSCELISISCSGFFPFMLHQLLTVCLLSLGSRFTSFGLIASHGCYGLFNSRTPPDIFFLPAETMALIHSVSVLLVF